MKSLLRNGVSTLAFLFICNFTIAQLCNGNLSDPIITIDFGAGNSNYGPALTTSETTYRFNNIGEIEDGEYTIAKNIQFGRTNWHNEEDRTPNDNGGYMLIVNADDQSSGGEFYRTRVSGLCENTLFEFSAWVINALQPNVCNPGLDINIKFEIRTPDGTLLASEDTGNIDESQTPQWRNVGITFNTGKNTELDVILKNNGIGGCGNDLAIDDISFRACGDVANIEADIANTEAICENNIPKQIELTANLEGDIYPNPVYQWQRLDDSNNWVTIPNEKNSTYIITSVDSGKSFRYLVAASENNLQNKNCAVTSEVINLNILENNFSIQGENDLCEGETLSWQISGDRSIQNVVWETPGGTMTGNPLNITDISSNQEGNYIATITDEWNCTFELQYNLNIRKNSSSTIEFEECENQQITLPDGSNYTISQTESFPLIIPNAEQCDSVITVNITANPVFNREIDTIICKNNSIVGPDGNSLVVENDMTLTYQYQTMNLCDSTVIKNIKVPQEVADNRETCFGESITLPDQTTIVASKDIVQTYRLNAVEYECDSIVNFSLKVHPAYDLEVPVTFCPLQENRLDNGKLITSSGNYPITYQTNEGCDSIVNYIVDIDLYSCDYEDLCQLRFPAAFSPNQDGINDNFGPESLPLCGFDNYHLTIFNRWGEIVFQTTDMNSRWTADNNGSFLWETSYTINIPNEGEKSFTKSGIVVALR